MRDVWVHLPLEEIDRRPIRSRDLHEASDTVRKLEDAMIRSHPYRGRYWRGFMTLLLTLTALNLAGCESLGNLWPFGDDEEEVPESTEQALYRSAQSSLRSGNYTAAITKLEALETRFPFGSYGEQAQLELIYAHFMAYDQESAIRAADRFIRLHPQHTNVDYAYYLRGLAQFESGRGYIDRIGTAEVARRDMTSVEAAFADFNQLVVRYPASSYAPDARQRMIYLRNLLAEAELAIADFYMRRGGFVAAANRARYVVENFPGAPATPDALVIIIEANHRLGLTDSANDALRVLAVNYPDHTGFDDQGNFLLEEVVRNRDRSWINILTFGLLDRPTPPPPIRIRQPEGIEPVEPIQPRSARSNSESTAPREDAPWYRRLARMIPFLGDDDESDDTDQGDG